MWPNPFTAVVARWRNPFCFRKRERRVKETVLPLGHQLGQWSRTSSRLVGHIFVITNCRPWPLDGTFRRELEKKKAHCPERRDLGLAAFTTADGRALGLEHISVAARHWSLKVMDNIQGCSGFGSDPAQLQW